MAGNTIKMKDLPSSESSRVTDLIGLDTQGQSVKLPNLQNELETEVANIGSKVGELVGDESTIDHSNDSLLEGKAWKIDAGMVTKIESPSNPNSMCIENPISLKKGDVVSITTTTYGASINLYIVANNNGNVIANKLPSSATTEESCEYTATDECLIYVNTLKYRNFVCIVRRNSSGKINEIDKEISAVKTRLTGVESQIGDVKSDLLEVKKDVEANRDNIGQIVGIDQDVDFTALDEYGGYINTSNNWADVSVAKCYMINVIKGSEITIKANSLKQSNYAFLKSTSIVAGEKADFVDGYASRYSVPIATEKTIIAPADCILFIHKSTPSGDFLPEYCKIKSSGELTNIKSDIESLSASCDKIDNFLGTDDIDFSKLKAQKGYITTLHRWRVLGSATCFIIKVAKGCKVSLKANSTRTSSYAMLDKPDIIDYVDPYFIKYFKFATFVTANAEVSFVTPQECYLYLQKTAESGADCFPQSIKIENAGGEFNIALDKVAEVEDNYCYKGYQFGTHSSGLYEVPVQDALVMQGDKLEYFYSLYDALVTQFPDYVTKVDCDAIATTRGIVRPSYMLDCPIYAYRFTPPYVPNSPEMDASVSYQSKIKAFLVSGTHGQEFISIWDLYNTMRLICENWQSSTVLTALRFDAEYFVIPCSNAYGVRNSTRKNGNQVDLNRNMPSSDWVKTGTPEDAAYSGETPNSEYESKMLTYLIFQEKPDLFIDHHNTNNVSPRIFLYTSSKHQLGVDLGASHIINMSVRWKSRFSRIFGQDKHMYGYSVHTQSTGTRANFGSEHCKLSLTVETQQSVCWENGVMDGVNRLNTSDASTLATDAFLNFLYVALKAIGS